MKNKNILLSFLFCILSSFPIPVSPLQGELSDPWVWLEDVDGINPLAWVEGQNMRTALALKSKPEFDELYKQALEVLNSESRIPRVTQRGQWLYNFWQDATHPRGIYRRTTLEEFRKAEPNWETVLDIDALSQKEGKLWVFHGMECLPKEYRQCLVSLSPGGTDASEIREFDMQTKAFVPNGFSLPNSKSSASWIDADTLYVNDAFDPATVTESGYSRIIRIWKRGTPITDAPIIFEGNRKSVSSGGLRIRTQSGDIDLVSETLTTWKSAYYQLLDRKLHKLNVPETASIEGAVPGKLLISLKEDWAVDGKKFLEGSVVLAEPGRLRGGQGKIELLAAPTATEIVEDVVSTRNGILVQTLDNIRGRLFRYEKQDSGWKRKQIPFPDNGSIDIATVDEESGSVFVQQESFTTPPALYYVASSDLTPQKMKPQEATFDGSQFEVQQYWTVSQDGTRVPYFAVMKKNMVLDGRNPTHIFSYGGFRNSLKPSYSGSYEHLSGAYGKLWLERGGVFVLANIRGGGEFGPSWHRAALRENRVKSFEDFEAIARDLVVRKITSPEHLAIEGRSNGGLLVAALMVRHPELYGAIICGSPLVDMLRYQKLLAGASWMAEYGDPESAADLAFLKTYSPYQLLEKDRKYPPLFVYASTRDDRVHPGHARKLVAKMIDLGYATTMYYENTEGGHGASSRNDQLAYRLALAYTHLWNQVGKKQ